MDASPPKTGDVRRDGDYFFIRFGDSEYGVDEGHARRLRDALTGALGEPSPPRRPADGYSELGHKGGQRVRELLELHRHLGPSPADVADGIDKRRIR